jgi:hypothetical protein
VDLYSTLSDAKVVWEPKHTRSGTGKQNVVQGTPSTLLLKLIKNIATRADAKNKVSMSLNEYAVSLTFTDCKDKS